MPGNGDKQVPQAPPQLGPKIGYLSINLHQGGHVTFDYPQDFKTFSYMVGQLLLNMPNFTFKKPSSIITLPPGTKIREP